MRRWHCVLSHRQCQAKTYDAGPYAHSPFSSLCNSPVKYTFFTLLKSPPLNSLSCLYSLFFHLPFLSLHFSSLLYLFCRVMLLCNQLSLLSLLCPVLPIQHITRTRQRSATFTTSLLIPHLLFFFIFLYAIHIFLLFHSISVHFLIFYYLYICIFIYLFIYLLTYLFT